MNEWYSKTRQRRVISCHHINYIVMFDVVEDSDWIQVLKWNNHQSPPLHDWYSKNRRHQCRVKHPMWSNYLKTTVQMFRSKGKQQQPWSGNKVTTHGLTLQLNKKYSYFCPSKHQNRKKNCAVKVFLFNNTCFNYLFFLLAQTCEFLHFILLNVSYD